MASLIPPVPPLPPELTELARWLQILRQNEIGGGSSDLYINVKDPAYGATGDGVTDDSAAIQAALTAGTTSGGTVFFPSGTYLVNTPLTVDTGTSWAHYGPRCSLKGAGSANTRILCTAASKLLLSIGGFGAQYYIEIDGIYFQGPGFEDRVGHPAVDLPGTGTALTTEASSWASVQNCAFRGWGTAVHMTDCFSVFFANSYFQTCLQGITLNNGIYASPNAISIVSCGISDNKNYGILVQYATTFSMQGGSIENNGVGGSGVFVGGAYVLASGSGASPCSFTGTYFEGNVGTDLYLDHPTDGGASSVTGCTFNRINATNYSTHNITVAAGSGVKARAIVLGCGFRGFNGYTPNAARTYINSVATGADAIQVSWSGCYFDSTTETPTIKNYLVGGTGVDNVARIIFAGGVGAFTPALPLTTCPAPGPAQWVEFTSDAIVAAGYSGFWTLGVPQP